MHGKGLYTWDDGRKYEGEYSMDQKHGKGVYQWADGRVYAGEWANGKQNGKGIYIMPDGTQRQGVWLDGKRINWIDEVKEDMVPEEPAENNESNSETN